MDHLMFLPDLDVILSSDLPVTDRMVLVVIASYANKAGAEVWPSIDTIAERSGVHRSTAVRSVKELKRLGWITVKKRFSQSAVYVIICHKSQIATSCDARLVAESDRSSRNLLPTVVAQSDSNHPYNHPKNSPNIKEPEIDPSEQDLCTPPPAQRPLPQKLGPLELRSIPGLKRLPKDLPALIELLNFVGIETLKQATLDCLNSGKEAYESNVSPIAIELKRLQDNPPEPERPPVEELPDDLRDLPKNHPLYPKSKSA